MKKSPITFEILTCFGLRYPPFGKQLFSALHEKWVYKIRHISFISPYKDIIEITCSILINNKDIAGNL